MTFCTPNPDGKHPESVCVTKHHDLCVSVWVSMHSMHCKAYHRDALHLMRPKVLWFQVLKPPINFLGVMLLHDVF